MSGSARIALAWLAALGRREASRLLALSDPAIMVFGPRGASKGHVGLNKWFAETRVALLPHAVLESGARILVRHQVEWLDTDGTRLKTAVNASVLSIRDGLVTSFLWAEGPDPIDQQGFFGARTIMLDGVAR